MFRRKTDYLKMEKIQYKALKTVSDINESLEDLILHNNEVSIHQKQLRQLTTEIYKIYNRFKSRVFKTVFYCQRIS